jgi:HSP20 family protein
MAMVVEPFAPWLRDFSRLLGSEGAVPGFNPPADVLVRDDGVKVLMDLPGVRREDLEIEVEGDTLVIRGERPYPYGQTSGNGESESGVRHIERGFGRFERTLRVPHGLDPNAVQASLVDGVLTVIVPRPESQRPHRVEIKAGDEQPVLEGNAA